jgi:hypothetical protein
MIFMVGVVVLRVLSLWRNMPESETSQCNVANSEAEGIDI